MQNPVGPGPDVQLAAARLVADRIKQGLPAEVTDPAALARIAAAVAGVPFSQSQEVA